MRFDAPLAGECAGGAGLARGVAGNRLLGSYLLDAERVRDLA